MSKWVRLEANKVIEIIPAAATVPSVASWYGKNFARQCVTAPDEAMPGWTYDPETGAFYAPETETAPDTEPETVVENGWELTPEAKLKELEDELLRLKSLLAEGE